MHSYFYTVLQYADRKALLSLFSETDNATMPEDAILNTQAVEKNKECRKWIGKN